MYRRDGQEYNTFSIPFTNASAEPMAETHNTMLLDKAVRGFLELTFPTSEKKQGSILVKKIGTDLLTSLSINSISMSFCPETCEIHKHKIVN